MVQIVPSILSADFARLGEDIATVERGGAKMLHVDVMDGHFVPNLTLGPPVVESIRRIINLTLDVHLMITDPDTFAPIFIEAGADQVSVHYEAATHLDRTLHHIQSLGARAGVVLNPATPGEICKGIGMLPVSQKRNSLRDWLDRDVRWWFAGRILPVTEDIAERWGHLAAAGKRNGVTLAVVDGVLAATALEHGLSRGVLRDCRSVIPAATVPDRRLAPIAARCASVRRALQLRSRWAATGSAPRVRANWRPACVRRSRRAWPALQRETTGLYGRRSDDISVGDVETIGI